jgi:hypothetical protein
MYKAAGYEDLMPTVIRFKKALKDGNEELANDLRTKLNSALSSKNAQESLSKSFSTIGEKF